MEHKIKPDFIATLKYRTLEEGGRNMPVKTGYRPGVLFEFDPMQTTGYQSFLNKKIVYPGDSVETEITILSVDYFAGKLEEGMTFFFCEGAKIIGTGIINQIINSKLQKK